MFPLFEHYDRHRQLAGRDARVDFEKSITVCAEDYKLRKSWKMNVQLLRIYGN